MASTLPYSLVTLLLADEILAETLQLKFSVSSAFALTANSMPSFFSVPTLEITLLNPVVVDNERCKSKFSLSMLKQFNARFVLCWMSPTSISKFTCFCFSHPRDGLPSRPSELKDTVLFVKLG